MKFSELARIAVRNLARRPLRNALAALGVVIGCAALVALLSLSAGVRAGLVRDVAARGALTVVQVLPSSSRSATALSSGALRQLAALPHVTRATPVVVVSGNLQLGDRTPGGNVLGMEFDALPYAFSSGNAPPAEQTDAIVLTASGAQRLSLFDASGAPTVTLRLRRGEHGEQTRDLALRVSGILADDIPGELAIVPLAVGEDALSWIATGESQAARDLRLEQQVTAQLLLGGAVLAEDAAASRYAAIWLVVDSPEHMDEVVADARRAGFTTTSASSALATINDLFAYVNAALGAISAIALLVATLGVLNALLTSVAERTVEIGILKAIGASDAVVERLFLLEGAFVGLIGGAGGVIGGWLAATGAAFLAQRAPAAARFGLRPELDVPLIGVAMLVSIVVSVIGAWLPARRAARLIPTDALRAE